MWNKVVITASFMLHSTSTLRRRQTIVNSFDSPTRIKDLNESRFAVLFPTQKSSILITGPGPQMMLTFSLLSGTIISAPWRRDRFGCLPWETVCRFSGIITDSWPVRVRCVINVGRGATVDGLRYWWFSRRWLISSWHCKGIGLYLISELLMDVCHGLKTKTCFILQREGTSGASVTHCAQQVEARLPSRLMAWSMSRRIIGRGLLGWNWSGVVWCVWVSDGQE